MNIGDIWNLIILSPTINILVVLSDYLFNSFGLAIIVLTIVIRVLTLPLTLKQLKATKSMQSLQPKLAELQKKHARDRSKLAQEQMRLYRDSGISPSGCMIPMFVQFPVWIALFQSIVRVLAVVPEDFLNLSQHLYSSWSVVFSIVPLGSKFLWLDLAAPDRIMLLPILVGGTMWVQQKMVVMPTTDPRQASQNQIMLWMMPLMFAFLTLQFPSGLALYWVVSNILSIVFQYYVTGWGGLLPGGSRKSAKETRYMKRIAKVEAKDSADIPSDAAPKSGESQEAEPASDQPTDKMRFIPRIMRERHPKKK